MRHFLPLAFVLLAIHSSSQDNMPASDSQVQQNISVRNMTDSLDSIAKARDMGRNISNIVQWQRDRDQREKRQGIVRIALGGLFLVVLIVGLLRTRSSKK